MGRGRFRTVQNWIGSPGSPIDEAQFVPPEQGSVFPCMGNWEKYYHSDAPDLIVQLAIVHAQFAIVHPFLDGNGRLGRIVIPLFLFEKGLLSRPVFYLRAIAKQAERNVEIARNILSLYARLKARTIELTRSQYAVPLLDALFEQPVFSASSLFDRPELPTKPVIIGLLKRLREADILAVLKGIERPKVSDPRLPRAAQSLRRN